MNTTTLSRFIVVLFCFTVLFSCVSNDSSSDTTGDSTTIQEYTVDRADSFASILWTYDAVADSMIKQDIPNELTVDFVLNELNNRYDEIRIDYVKTSADTVFLKIDDVSYLGQMGSTGNYAFMAEVVYSLTEVPNVKLIHFDFPELDHAMPGLYERADFNNKITP